MTELEIEIQVKLHSCCLYWQDFIREWEIIKFNWVHGFHVKYRKLVQLGNPGFHNTYEDSVKHESLQCFNSKIDKLYLKKKSKFDADIERSNSEIELAWKYYRYERKEFWCTVSDKKIGASVKDIDSQAHTNAYNTLKDNSGKEVLVPMKESSSTISYLSEISSIPINKGELKFESQLLTIPAIIGNAYFCAYLYKKLSVKFPLSSGNIQNEESEVDDVLIIKALKFKSLQLQLLLIHYVEPNRLKRTGNNIESLVIHLDCKYKKDIEKHLKIIDNWTQKDLSSRRLSHKKKNTELVLTKLVGNEKLKAEEDLLILNNLIANL